MHTAIVITRRRSREVAKQVAAANARISIDSLAPEAAVSEMDAQDPRHAGHFSEGAEPFMKFPSSATAHWKETCSEHPTYSSYTQAGCCQEVNGCRNGESHPSRSGYCLIASCANIFPLPATNCHGNIRHALTYNAELSAVGSSAGNTRKCDCATGVYCNMQGNSHVLRQKAPLSRVGCLAVSLAGVPAVTPCFPASA
jgi:hypothetical protein